MEIIGLLRRLLSAIIVGVVVGLIVWIVGMILSEVPFAIVSGIGEFLVLVAPWLGLLAGLFELLSGASGKWLETHRQ